MEVHENVTQYWTSLKQTQWTKWTNSLKPSLSSSITYLLMLRWREWHATDSHTSLGLSIVQFEQNKY